jgi:hypothetical protein
VIVVVQWRVVRERTNVVEDVLLMVKEKLLSADTYS